MRGLSGMSDESQKFIKLGNLIKFKYGKSLPNRERDPDGKYLVFGSGGKIGLHNSYLTESPVIVVGRKGSIGSTFYSDNPCWCIDTTYYVDQFSSNLYSKYLYYFLNTLKLDRLNRAATIPGLSRDDLYTFSIPIPYPNNPKLSLDIQQRIVARIESLFGEIKRNRLLLEQMRLDNDLLLPNALDEVVERLDSKRQTLLDVIQEKPRNGWSPKCDNDPNGVPVLKLGAVLRFQYNPDEIKRTSLPTDENAHYWLEAGDILISRSNTLDLVGHASIYSGIPYPCIYPDLIMRFRVNPNKADSKFLMYWLQSKEVRHYIQTNASGASPTMKKIKQETVCNIPFPIISLEEQSYFAYHLDAIQQEVNKINRIIEEDEQNFKYLEQAILEKAFRGEL